MEWNKEQVCLLIDLYRDYKVLWDPSDPEYKNRNRKHDAWATIAATMDTTKEEVESKMRNLIGQFQREDKKGKSSGSGAEEANRKWFAYKLLLFLRDKTLPNHSREAGFADHTQYQYIIQNEETTETQEETKDEGESTFVDTPGCSSTSTVFTAANSDTNKPTKRVLSDKAGKSYKKKPSTYEMAQEAYNTMRNLQGQLAMPQKKDEFDVFGEFVAHSLRNLKTKHAKVVVKHEINNLLFNAEMGFYDEPTTVYSRQPSLSYNSTPCSSLNPSPIPQVCQINQQQQNNEVSPVENTIEGLINL